MKSERKHGLALYVDRVNQQWVVEDPEGNFWIVHVNQINAWDQREEYHPSEEAELEPVPGHYKAMLGLPTN
jgi:hypothetical protein